MATWEEAAPTGPWTWRRPGLAPERREKRPAEEPPHPREGGPATQAGAPSPRALDGMQVRSSARHRCRRNVALFVECIGSGRIPTPVTVIKQDDLDMPVRKLLYAPMERGPCPSNPAKKSFTRTLALSVSEFVDCRRGRAFCYVVILALLSVNVPILLV